MKNALLVLNGVLLVAVAVLFYLHFSDRKPTTAATKTVVQNGAVPSGDFKIAYFEMDSVNNSFGLVKEVRDQLTKEESRLTNQLTQLQKKYNDRVTQFQSQSRQGLSQIESEKMNREILQLQDEFANARQNMQQRLQDLSMRKTQEVKNKVEEYLKEYNSSKGFAYILAYEPGFIFYRDSALNITADLVKGLNERYKKK